MHEHEARLEKLQAERSRGAQGDADAQAARRGARGRARALGRARDPGRGPRRSATCRAAARWPPTARGRGARDASRRRRSSRRSAASGSGSSGRTAPARRRCCARSRATCRRSTGASASATRSRSATSPSCATRRSPARRSSTRSSRRSRSRPARRAATSPGSCSAATTCSRRSGTLSGGERSRLELALLGIMPSNLLLLDEPTNHLDIAAREAIESFLAESPATILVVSHDRRLLETVCERAVGRRRRRSPCRSTAAIAPGARRRRRLDGPSAGARGGAAAAGAGRARLRAPPTRGRRLAAAARLDGRGRRTAARRRRGGPAPPRRARPGSAAPKLSKDAYRRRASALDAELGRLGLRKSQLELALGTPVDHVELRRDAPGHERARRRRARAGRGRGRLAGARGAGTVTPPAVPRPSGSGSPGRSAAASRRSPAGSASCGAIVIDADAGRARGHGPRAAGSRRRRRARSATAVRRRTATLDRAALGRIVFADPARPARARGDRPSGRPAADPRADRGGRARRARRRVVDRGDQARRGRARGRCATRSGSSPATPNVQRYRLVRRGTSPEEADQRIAAQAGLVARLSSAATRIDRHERLGGADAGAGDRRPQGRDRAALRRGRWQRAARPGEPGRAVGGASGQRRATEGAAGSGVLPGQPADRSSAPWQASPDDRCGTPDDGSPAWPRCVRW